MIERHKRLFSDYWMRTLTNEEMHEYFRKNCGKVFGGDLTFDFSRALSPRERRVSKKLLEKMGTPFSLSVGFFQREKSVGWSFGWQENIERYYMMNTGILPGHRNKGIYTAFLPAYLEMIRDAGFQIVYSRHRATNNQVIVPKLKAGFVISGFEMTDAFGLLVHLSYFTSPLRRKAINFRVGEVRLDEELEGYMIG